MIYNPLFFSNPYYRRPLNLKQYSSGYNNKSSNTNFNNYSNNFVNPYSNNYSSNYANNFSNSHHTSYTNNYYKNSNFSQSNNNTSQLKSEVDLQKEKEEHIEPELFEIFGIKLYFDDILLICLIFFLYNEGVKDQYLFISLILLLLT